MNNLIKYEKKMKNDGKRAFYGLLFSAVYCGPRNGTNQGPPLNHQNVI